MTAQQDVTAWVETLRRNTDKRFFLGKIIESGSPDVKYEKPIAFRVCLVGRIPSCDIRIEDNYCSRKHALIYFKDGAPVVRDLDSRTGTTLNNITLVVGRDYPLSHGDIVSIVGRRFAFIFEEPLAVAVKPRLDDVKIGLESHKCPYCYRFIPEFSMELANMRAQIRDIIAKADLMEQSYTSLRTVSHQLSDIVELVEQHHNTYHSELLADVRETEEEIAQEDLRALEELQEKTRTLRAARDGGDDSGDGDEPPKYRPARGGAPGAEGSEGSEEGLEEDLEEGPEGEAAEPPAKQAGKSGVFRSLLSSLMGKSRGRPAAAEGSGSDDHAPDAEGLEEEAAEDEEYAPEGAESYEDVSSGDAEEAEDESEGGDNDDESGDGHGAVRFAEPERASGPAGAAPAKAGKDTPAPPKYDFDEEED